ncbi:hypothetical protein PF001_g23958, partial [Phytophthora fragariae]
FEDECNYCFKIVLCNGHTSSHPFVAAAVLVVLCSGGLVLGFGPVYSLLVDEGQWSELCAPDEAVSGVTCASQEVKLQYIYSTVFLCLSFANVASGVSLDVMGARLTVCFGLVISVVGNVLLALGQSTDDNGVSIIAGYSLIGVGGYGVYISAFQLVLFPPEQQGRIASVMSGLFNLSGYVYLLLQIHGLTRESFFLGYAVLVAVCLVVAFVLFPLNSVSSTSETYTLSGFTMKWPTVTKPKSMWPALSSQIGRKDLWFFAVFFGWVSTINAFIGGAIPNIIYKNDGDDDSLGDLYVNYLQPLITNGTFIYTPLLGWVIDKFGCRVVLFVTLLSTHVVIVLLLVPSLTAQTFMLVLFAFEQSAFYTLQFAYILLTFPAEVYGSVQAFLAACSFLMGLLNYAFTPWVQNGLDGDYLVVLLIMAAPVLLIMAAPVLVMYFFMGLIRNNSLLIDAKSGAAADEELEQGKPSVD